MSTEKAAKLAAGSFQDALAATVEARRKELGMSQLQCAVLIGRDRGNWSRIESGKHFPKLITLTMVASALRLSIAELLMRAIEQDAKSTRKLELVKSA